MTRSQSNGRPFSAVVNGDVNGDEATSNDLAFVFDPDDPATPPAVAASMRKVLDNPLNQSWGAEYQLPVGISNQNPVVQRIPLLNVVGFDQASKRYVYTVNENFGVLQKAGAPYQIQLAARYAF